MPTAERDETEPVKQPIARLAYPVEEAAYKCGISRAKLYELLNAQRISAKKIDDRTVILHRDLESFLDALPNYMPR